MDSVIDGDRVRLRLWEDTDQPRSLTCSNGRGEAFGDWLPGVTKDLANIPAFIRHVTDEFLNQSAFFYAIEGEGEPVGQVSLRLRSPGSGEVGYWVHGQDQEWLRHPWGDRGVRSSIPGRARGVGHPLRRGQQSQRVGGAQGRPHACSH